MAGDAVPGGNPPGMAPAGDCGETVNCEAGTEAMAGVIAPK